MSNLKVACENEPTLVVGVGASTCDLKAFEELLSVLPHNGGVAYILVQHLDPTHGSLIAELLAPHTPLPVLNVKQGDRLLPNTIYVTVPGRALAIRNGHIELSERILHHRLRSPINHLFRSLAREFGSRAVGIVLSGAGSDGVDALRDIKLAGGLTIAQRPESDRQSGMPRNAIESGLIELILAIDDIPDALQRFVGLPDSARLESSTETVELYCKNTQTDSALRDEPLAALGGPFLHKEDESRSVSSLDTNVPVTMHQLVQLKAMVIAQTDFDLGIYKPRTLRRRLLRRMLLSGFGDTDTYLQYLRSEPKEQHTLIRDLLISVTSFFRDADAFKVLRESVIEPMIASPVSQSELRIWVAGCATGEEAYSIGMVILDALEERGRSAKLQIFATDVDQKALAVAREGCYPPSIVDHVSKRRLDRYFDQLDRGGYQIRSFLRDCISFAEHDLSRDPPFSRMHLVSCRNVMIYLTPTAQEQVLSVLHYSLRPDSYLFLGTSEATGAKPELFDTLSKSAHIYRKRETRGTVSPYSKPRRLPTAAGLPAKIRHKHLDRNSTNDDNVANPARQLVLETWAPPTILVGELGDVIFMHGELSPYLSFPQGDHPRLHLDAMLRKSIAAHVLSALYQCRRKDEAIVVTMADKEQAHSRVRLTAKPAPMCDSPAVMLSFEAVDTAVERQQCRSKNDLADSDETSREDYEVQRLDEELKVTREDLRNTVEELETANEELRATSEESMSMNQELQSTNEELEATTEELRSLNEELSTVNAQLRDKIEEQVQTNDDLINFFTSAAVPIVFLDEYLRIKRFTPAAATLLGIDRSDVGRFTGDIARELLQYDLENESRLVLEHLVERSAELKTRDGRWFTRRVLPYRTGSRRIEGVVVTLSEVTELKCTSEQLLARERQQRVIARLGLAALDDGDLDQFMDRTTRELMETLELDHCKILELQPGGKRLLLRAGVGWNQGLVGYGWVDAGLDSQAGYTLSKPDEPVIVDDLNKETRFTGPDLLLKHGVTSGLSCVILAGNHIYGVIGGHTREPRKFSQEDLNFLQSAANVVGSSINRHQDRLRQNLENAVSATLQKRYVVDDTLAAIQSIVVAELRCETSELWWTDEHGCFVCRHHYTLPQVWRQQTEDRDSELNSGMADCLAMRVFTEKRAVWATDIGEPALFTAESPAVKLGFTSAFGLPICTDDKVLGVMVFYARRRLFGIDVFLRSLENLGSTVGAELARQLQK